MTDTTEGPTTATMEADAPVRREKMEILQSRKDLVVSQTTGVLTPKDLAQALEFSQAMAKAESAVPAHLRGSPGACLAIIEYANAWGLMAYGVANQSYVVSERLCFMGQLIHAIIKKRVPLRFPNLGLESRYEGDIANATRKCIVSAEVYVDDARTVTKVLEWESPMLKDISPKNSPLWKTDPDQQLFYRTTSRWQRRYFPEITLGVYTKEEMEEISTEVHAATAEHGGRITISDRLPGHNGGEGYRPENVEMIAGPMGAADELDMVATDIPGVPVDVAPTKNAAPSEAAGEAAGTQSAGEAGGAQAPQEAADAGKPAGDKKPRAKRTAAATPAATAAAPAAEKPKPNPPATAEEYEAYLADWMARATDDAAIHDRWGDEKELRGRCGVVGDSMTRCREIKDAKVRKITGDDL